MLISSVVIKVDQDISTKILNAIKNTCSFIKNHDLGYVWITINLHQEIWFDAQMLSKIEITLTWKANPH